METELSVCLPPTDWAALAAIGAIVAALSAVTAQLVQSRHRRLGRRIDLVLKFEAQFETVNFIMIRQRAATFLLSRDPADKRGEDAVYSVLNFFESVGYFREKKLLDDESIWTFLSFWMLKYCAAAKQQLSDARARDNDSFAYISPMFEAMKQYKQKRNPMRSIEHLVSPAQVKEFLEDESSLLSETPPGGK
jgi:hypothetical protein